MNKKPYFSPVEVVIAEGRLAIIAALEGKFITCGGSCYVQVRNGKFFNPGAARTVTLTRLEQDTLERYYRESVPIVELAQPENRNQREALEWFLSLPPDARTIQLGFLYADRMERNERHAQAIAGG